MQRPYEDPAADAAPAQRHPFLAGDDVATRLVRAADWAATPSGNC